MSPEQRSAHMAKIRSKNTKPELVLRSLLHGEGFRYRLHGRQLPGKPDLVFQSRKKVIFVNGCFWHGHDCHVGKRLPKSNTEFWQAKRLRNQERDREQRLELVASNWSYLDVWECEILADANLLKRVTGFLRSEA
ncbi:very short patch repair endonuclease [Arthrobacter sp. 9V]|uniref:very short patch repair endonuclease n=1 Tax=Arthrobacter sp. 9V TaxID=2653132 RepID=UPI001F22305E|nr:very short patch repair endonuclease [Arthrobacter sp. 9V]